MMKRIDHTAHRRLPVKPEGDPNRGLLARATTGVASGCSGFRPGLRDPAVTTSADEPKLDRRARRRAETRAKLIAAARTTFARQGVDATRINEITDEADVGFGSFYNHFESKDAIVAAVVEDAATAAAEAIDAATRDVEDPAEVVAVAHRALIRQAREDQEFGWLLVRLEISHDMAFEALGPYAARDLRRGIKAGRFNVDDPAFALTAAGGALLAVVRAMLQGRTQADAAERHAAYILRMFGLAPEDAAEVARRPMPSGL
jgi:AcrR family transcriptional regulator